MGRHRYSLKGQVFPISGRQGQEHLLPTSAVQQDLHLARERNVDQVEGFRRRSHGHGDNVLLVKFIPQQSP